MRKAFFSIALGALILAITPTHAILFDEEDIQQQMVEIEQAKGRFLIINGDDFGMSHSTNIGMIECFEKGIVTSATIMMPCPAIQEAIDYKRREPRADVGLHLTLTNEWKSHHWGTVAPKELVPSLYKTGTDQMWPEVRPVYQHAKLPEARREILAQLDLARELGLDFNHLDCHMGWYHFSPHLYRVVQHIAEKERLPIRVSLPPRIWSLRSEGLWVTDRLDYTLNGHKKEQLKDDLIQWIRGLEEGITELVWHPAFCNEELRSITGTAEARDMQRALLVDPDVKDVVIEERIILIGYEPLRRLSARP